MGSKKSAKQKCKSEDIQRINAELSNKKYQPHPTDKKPTHLAFYQGPIPPPALLEQLESILPGAADRVFRMAEGEQRNRHLLAEKKCEQLNVALSNEHSENICALWMAFCVCIVFGSLGVYTLMNGHEIIGSLLAGTTITSVVASFLVSRKDRKANSQLPKSPQKTD